MQNKEFTSGIIASCIYIHNELGPGLLENTYKQCLKHELIDRGYSVRSEVPIPLIYKDVHLDCGFRADLVINNQIVLEVKSVDALNNIHLAQVLTYLRLGGYKLGYLLNFNVELMKHGIRRVIN